MLHLLSAVGLLAPAAFSVLAPSPDDQAYLGVFADTQVMKMVGMPAMPELPAGIKLPAGVQLPGRPSRKLEVRLWSPGLAPDGATASLAVPEGLKQGARLDLTLYRPKPEESDGGADTAPGGVKPADFTLKRYWGSSATVKPGQPEVIHWGDLSPEARAMMREQAQRARRSGGSYFYKPNWTTGYWPAGQRAPAIAADAGLPGHYALSTTYTGNAEIDVPDKVDFLAPIDLSSPDFSQKIDFGQAIDFRWKAVPNILGYHAMVMAMQGKNTFIIWDSSEIKTDAGMTWDYMQMADVIERVKSTAMMGPDRTSVTVPAGIFNDCDFVSLMMVGYGPGAALDKGQPLPRVQTKTSLTAMLGGKMAERMGGGDR